MEITEPRELLENEVIVNLINDKEYFETVFPFLKSEYFSYEYSTVIKHIEKFYKTYKKSPSLKELVISFKDSNKQDKEVIKQKINELKDYKQLDHDFLIDSTESFIKRKIFEKAIITGAEGLGSNNEEKVQDSFKLAEESVKVTLESDIGIELQDIDSRFDDYLPQNGLKLNIKSFDSVIGDGYTPGTLHLIISPSGVGKSAMLSTFAVQFLLQKRDVVLLSLEMSESQFYKRIDSNICDISIQNLGIIDKQVLKNRYNDNRENLGNLIIKEFPAGALTPLKIDSFLNKIENEKGIKNPILMVDYLTLMKSDIIKQGDNSYSYFKSVAEELRAVAQKRGIIIFTPMQSNRSSINNIEADQSSLSDSMAVYMTSDSAFMILQTPEMKEAGKMKINFVKNRMSGKTFSFDIGYDYEKFRIIDKFYDSGHNENITMIEHKRSDEFNIENTLQDLML
jgi:replicative DNA helicase